MDSRFPAPVRDNIEAAYVMSAKSMGAWCIPTKVFPRLTTLPKPVSVYRLGAVRDVFVERDDVKGTAASIYESVRAGEVARLAAGTGTGKSTEVPCYLASHFQTTGVVVTPDRWIARSLYKYIKYTVIPRSYPKVAAVMPLSPVDMTMVTSPAVCVVSATDFLNIHVQDNNQFTSGKVGFIYMDEAHEKTAEYFVMRLMVGNKLLGLARVFMGSATGNSANLESRLGTKVKFSVNRVKPADMNYETPGELNTKSPLHWSAIKVRTMIFVPSAASMPTLVEYYSSNGLEVLTLSEFSESEDWETVDKSLARGKRPVAFLTTQKFQTAYTFDVDACVDCGVTRYMKINLETKEFVMAERRCTASERIQRAGRVGRHMDGVAYIVDAEPAPDEYEVTPGYEVYVALWCYLLGYEYRAPGQQQWLDVLGRLSPQKAAVMLHMTLHPVFSTHYLDEDGACLGDTMALISGLVNTRDFLNKSIDESYETYVNTWMVAHTGNVDWLQQTAGYRTPMVPPREWTAVVYALYVKLVNRYMEMYEPGYRDDVSEYTVVENPTDVGLRKMYRKPTSKRRVTTYDTPAADAFPGTLGDVPSMPSSYRRSSEGSVRVHRQGVVGSGPTPAPLTRVPEMSPLPDVSVNSRRRESESRRHRSKRSSASSADGAVQVARLSRVQIPVSKTHNQRLYPYDDLLFDRFVMATEMVTDEDRYRFAQLRKRKVEISALTDADCSDYFLSVLRQWNGVVVSNYQLKSSSTRSLFFGGGDRTKATYNDQKQACRALFMAFDFRGLYIAEARSSRQSESSGTSATSAAGKLTRLDEESAVYMLSVGNEVVRSAVVSVKYRLNLHVEDGVRKGLQLKVGDYGLGTYHTFATEKGAKVGVSTPTSGVVRVVSDNVMDWIVFVYSGFPHWDTALKLRAPQSCEDVLVVSISLVSDERVVLGPYQVRGFADDWVYMGSVPDGFSGSVLVSVVDGAILGLHVGRFGEVGGDMASTFVPSQVFMSVVN